MSSVQIAKLQHQIKALKEELAMRDVIAQQQLMRGEGPPSSLTFMIAPELTANDAANLRQVRFGPFLPL